MVDLGALQLFLLQLSANQTRSYYCTVSENYTNVAEPLED